MNIDSFTTAALADEFRLLIMGGRVQRVVQITPLSIGLEIYALKQRRYLSLCAAPQTPYAYLQNSKHRRGVGAETPILQLFRKYLHGSILMTIEQPPYERVLLFHFSGKNGSVIVVLEMMGNRSNLICLDEDKRILALVRPVPPHSKRRRVLLPNHQYTLPILQDKVAVNSLSIKTLKQLITTASPKQLLSKTLPKWLIGLNPLIAREITYRAYQKTNITLAELATLPPLLEAIQTVYSHINQHNWQPHVSYTADNVVEYFAPIALTHLNQATAIESISLAVQKHFDHDHSGSSDEYFAARAPLYSLIKKAYPRLKRRLDKLNQDAANLKNPEVFKQKGDAILSYSYQIKSRQTTLTVPWLDDTPLQITLDPTLSPSDNAQRYFARYRKAKRAAEIIPKQRQIIQHQLEYLKQLNLDLDLAETRPEIDAVAIALNKTGFGRRSGSKKANKKITTPRIKLRRFTSPDGFRVLVGKNASQNHRLTFGKANPDDIWLHARGLPGSHVIITSNHGQPPHSTILWAAGLAAYYSKGRNENLVDVSYTLKKHVRAIKGAPPGLVSIKQEKTVRVKPFTTEEG